MSNIICCCVRTSARLRTLRSHFLPLPFFFLLVFLLFLRPPGMTGFIAGGLVGDGFGAEASVVLKKEYRKGGGGVGIEMILVVGHLHDATGVLDGGLWAGLDDCYFGALAHDELLA